MLHFLATAALTGLTSAHSWLHCSDYRGDLINYEEDQCFGNPRPLGGVVPQQRAFGADFGFNQQPGNTACHSAETSLAAFPMATYARGQTITLAWPTKNHVAAECTNPFIPDTSLELFVQPAANGDDPTAWTQVRASFSDDPHENGQIDFKGFQNCPDFCNNLDKSLCTGTFMVPANLADGTYTFQWRWIFNQGSGAYVTCYDAQVAGNAAIPAPAPLPAVTPRPTTIGETPRPTTAQEAECGVAGDPCGGALFSGPSCCAAGLQCYKQSLWFSACLPECPLNEDPVWECSAGSSCVGLGQQCGGKYHVGSNCCEEGNCFSNSPFYAQCRNECPIGWQCHNEFSGSFESNSSSSGVSGGWTAFFLFLALAACLGGAFMAKKVTEHRYLKLQTDHEAQAPSDLHLRKTQSDLQMPPVNKPAMGRKLSKPPSGVPPPPPGNPPLPIV